MVYAWLLSGSGWWSGGGWLIIFLAPWCFWWCDCDSLVDDDSQHWLKFVMVGWFVECETLLRGWLVGWVMNDDSVTRVRWVGVSVTCYLLLGAHVLWLFGRRRVNCRVVWGLDRWAVRVVGFGCWFLWWLFWLEIGVNHVISRDFRLVCWWIVIWLKWWFESGVWGWSVVERGVMESDGVWHWLLEKRSRWCDSVVEVIVCPSIFWSGSGRGDRGWGVTEVTERLMIFGCRIGCESL